MRPPCVFSPAFPVTGGETIRRFSVMLWRVTGLVAAVGPARPATREGSWSAGRALPDLAPAVCGYHRALVRCSARLADRYRERTHGGRKLPPGCCEGTNR